MLRNVGACGCGPMPISDHSAAAFISRLPVLKPLLSSLAMPHACGATLQYHGRNAKSSVSICTLLKSTSFHVVSGPSSPFVSAALALSAHLFRKASHKQRRQHAPSMRDALPPHVRLTRTS